MAQTGGVVVEVATRDPRAYKAAFQTIVQDFFWQSDNSYVRDPISNFSFSKETIGSILLSGVNFVWESIWNINFYILNNKLKESHMEQFIEELIEVFERDDIDPDDEFRDYEEWDSMAYLSLIASIDDNYDIVIPGEEFANLNKIIDIYNYINNHHKN